MSELRKERKQFFIVKKNEINEQKKVRTMLIIYWKLKHTRIYFQSRKIQAQCILICIQRKRKKNKYIYLF